MFLDYYRLHEQPFGVTPDPSYLYLGRTHRAALDALTCGISDDRGFMAIIAKPGMGKTTLLYCLLEQLRDTARAVFLFQTQCNSREFFGYLLSELGIDPLGMNLVAMHDRLNKTLFSEMLAGRRFVLVVDEAQDLAEPVLETIRLLSNFETPHAKLLQIILAGQPQLAEKLASPALAQLRQRITVSSRLDPFSAEETANYIHHRLRVGGHSGDSPFTQDALAIIAERSEGIPRNINNLCFNALSLGCARGLKLLGPEVVQEAAAELSLDSVVPQSCTGTESQPPIDLRLPAPLTYKPAGRRVGWRRVYGGAVLASIMFLGGRALFPSFGNLVNAAPRGAFHMSVEQAVDPTLSGPQISPAPFSSLDSMSEPVASGTASPSIPSLQFLIVAVRPQETLREVSLRYLGRFDEKLLNQISALNPELKDPNHIEAWNLVRLPLPPGTLKKGYDTAALNSTTRNTPTN